VNPALAGDSSEAPRLPFAGRSPRSGDSGDRRPDVSPVAVALLAGLLIGLGFLEARLGGSLPVALGAAALIVYAALCVLHLTSAMLVLVAVTPFSLERAIPGTGSALQLPTEPMLFLALGAWLIRSLSRGRLNMAQGALTATLIAALGACLLSLLDSRFPATVLKATLNATWYALFGLYLANNLRSDRALGGAAIALLLPGTIVCLLSMFLVSIGYYDPSQGYWSVGPFFTEHGSYAAYMTFVFLVALALTVERDGFAKLLFGVPAILAGAQVLLSFTRGAWLGVAVAAPFLALVWRRRLTRGGNLALVGVGVVGLAVFVVSSGVLTRLEKHTGTITDPSYVSNLERVNRWFAGWRMFQSDPLTGVGFGTYVDHYRNSRRIELATDQSTTNMGVHSEYLRVLAETGIAGMAAALATGVVLLVVALRAIRRSRTPLRRALSVGLSGGLVAYLVHAAVNNFIQYDKVGIPVWLAIGVLAAIERLETE
jgi:O-antigen ligase